MAENSAIGWTDATFNGWLGCTEVGPGCDLCYAREQDKRYQWGIPKAERVPGIAPHWGAGAPRYRTSDNNWRKVLKWNAYAQSRGVPLKVFAHSLSDVFDNEVPQQWREDEFSLWRATPWLRWIVVTKRITSVPKMLPKDWGSGYPNVGIVVTVVDQDEYDRDAPRLLSIPARWHGFSMEPQIDRIRVRAEWTVDRGSIWCITGGESAQPSAGKQPRQYDPAWARSLIRAKGLCPDLYVYVKQMGARPVGLQLEDDKMGKDPAEWPADLRVFDFPPELLS
jgi:protein gp37